MNPRPNRQDTWRSPNIYNTLRMDTRTCGNWRQRKGGPSSKTSSDPENESTAKENNPQIGKSKCNLPIDQAAKPEWLEQRQKDGGSTTSDVKHHNGKSETINTYLREDWQQTKTHCMDRKASNRSLLAEPVLCMIQDHRRCKVPKVQRSKRNSQTLPSGMPRIWKEKRQTRAESRDRRDESR